MKLETITQTPGHAEKKGNKGKHLIFKWLVPPVAIEKNDRFRDLLVLDVGEQGEHLLLVVKNLGLLGFKEAPLK